MTASLHFRKFVFRKTKFNQVITLLTLSDVFAWGSNMVITAITGIYLAQRIDENIVQIVGIGTAIHCAVRGIFELTFGKLLDKWKYDNDEIIGLSVGTILMGSIYLFYPFIQSANLFYALQFVFATGAALNLVSWKKLFSQNLDHHAEGVEYGEYGLVMGIIQAIIGIFAGSIANLSEYYFSLVIFALGIVTMAGSIFSLAIFMVKKRKSSIW